MIIKKIEHIWSIICSKSIIDQESNNLSLLNVIEQLTVDAKKIESSGRDEKNRVYVVPIEMTLVSRFKKVVDPKEKIFLEAQYRQFDPDKRLLGTLDTQFEMGNGIKNFRLRNLFNNLPITKSGTYTFVINLREKGENAFIEVATIPLDITLNIK